MYAFIQEELLYNSVNKPELRTPTLFVDSSHIQTESMMMQRSARLVIEKVFEGYFPDTLILTSDGIHDFVNLDCMENALSSDGSDFDRF